MRFLFRLILLLIFVLPLAVALAIYLAVDSHPTIDRAASITPASAERPKQVLQQNDPRKLKSGEGRSFPPGAADLDLAAQYLAQQFGRGSARVRVQNGVVKSSASLRLPVIPLPLYLNMNATLAETESHARLGCEFARLRKAPSI